MDAERSRSIFVTDSLAFSAAGKRSLDGPGALPHRSYTKSSNERV